MNANANIFQKGADRFLNYSSMLEKAVAEAGASEICSMYAELYEAISPLHDKIEWKKSRYIGKITDLEILGYIGKITDLEILGVPEVHLRLFKSHIVIALRDAYIHFPEKKMKFRSVVIETLKKRYGVITRISSHTQPYFSCERTTYGVNKMPLKTHLETLAREYPENIKFYAGLPEFILDRITDMYAMKIEDAKMLKPAIAENRKSFARKLQYLTLDSINEEDFKRFYLSISEEDRIEFFKVLLSGDCNREHVARIDGFLRKASISDKVIMEAGRRLLSEMPLN